MERYFPAVTSTLVMITFQITGKCSTTVTNSGFHSNRGVQSTGIREKVSHYNYSRQKRWCSV